jgi:hypothetical protein
LEEQRSPRSEHCRTARRSSAAGVVIVSCVVELGLAPSRVGGGGDGRSRAR